MRNPPTIDGDYLRSVLSLSADEHIRSVDVTEVAETNTALAIKLSAVIQRAARTDVRRLFIKTVKSDDAENVYGEMGAKEARFYEFARGVRGSALPIPACHDAFVDDDKFVIVLDDVSDKYRAPDESDLADKETWLRCAESLARFHAAFWNLRNTNGHPFTVATEQALRDNAAGDRAHLRRFFVHAGERFDEATRRVFRRAMEINNALIMEGRARVLSRRNVTVTNDDSHIYNFMLPVKSGEKPIIVDFQFWGRGIGTGDLAHLTRVHFPKAYRRSLHTEIVERYHQTLTAHGVDGYSRDECLRDYRASVAAVALIPVWQFAFFGLKYEDWSGGIDALIDNYNSLDCDDLLELLEE
jgi:hypothetical protein